MKLSAGLLLAGLLGFRPSFAQSPLPQFGSYNSDEVAMTQCAFDKDADAVVLLDEAFSDYDDDWELVTKRRVRIKVLTERGIDNGNIEIPFYSKDKFEYIRNVQGVSFSTTDNKFYNLDRKSIFTDKIDERRSKVKFAMPNVRAGTIIEYSYESVMKNYGGLDRWVFQSELPTIRSCYLLQVIPNHEFSYVISKKDNYPVIVTPKPDLGQIYFEMNNVPGLRLEPYMDAAKDYLQQVEFQLSGYANPSGSMHSVYSTWKDIASDLSTDRALGGCIKKEAPKIDELTALVEKETNVIGKIGTIYNYVRDHFTWNGYDSKYAIDGLKQVWEKRAGNSGELNLLLVNLLQSFGIEASPMLAAERDFGRVDPKFVFVDRFNKTVVYASAEGKTYVLDVTQKFCPPSLTPYPLLNTFGLVVDKKTTELQSIRSGGETFVSNVKIDAKLDNAGLFTGTALILSDQYAKQSRSESVSDDVKKTVKRFQDDNPGISVDSFSYENLKSDDKPLVEHVRFSEQLDKSGTFVLLNCNLFSGLGRSPFTKDERFTNVDFGYPYNVTIKETIELPSNTKIDAIPVDKKLVTPARDISIARRIRQNGQTLEVEIAFVQTATVVSYNDYAGLKEFYRQMVNALNEPVTIKLAN